MKTLVFVSALFLLVSCDVYYVEPQPVYDPRDQFTGTYDVNEYSSTYDEYWEYSVSVSKSSYSYLVIDNFYNSGLRATATVNGNRIQIDWQVIDGYEVQGEGRLTGSKLIMNYKVRDTYTAGSAWDFCEATGWRF